MGKKLTREQFMQLREKLIPELEKQLENGVNRSQLFEFLADKGIEKHNATTLLDEAMQNLELRKHQRREKYDFATPIAMIFFGSLAFWVGKIYFINDTGWSVISIVSIAIFFGAPLVAITGVGLLIYKLFNLFKKSN